MLPFTLEEALKGKLCQLRNGMFAQIYMDIRDNPYIDTKNEESVLVGIIFPTSSIPGNCKWRIDGLGPFSPHSYDIVGILEPDELYILENYKILYDAYRNNHHHLKVFEPGFEKPAKVTKRNDDGTFTLCFGEYTKDMKTSDFKDLKIIEKI